MCDLVEGTFMVDMESRAAISSRRTIKRVERLRMRCERDCPDMYWDSVEEYVVSCLH